jgi:hypothetical protein
VVISNGVSVSGVDFSVFILTASPARSPGAAGAGAMIGIGESAVPVDARGNYTFAGLPNGSYFVTPTKPGYTFSPASQLIVVNNAHVTGVNFTATPITIGGTITPAADSSGAIVILNAGPTTATVDAAGAFTFSGMPNGTYTLTPRKRVHLHAVSQTVTVSGTSVSGSRSHGCSHDRRHHHRPDQDCRSRRAETIASGAARRRPAMAAAGLRRGLQRRPGRDHGDRSLAEPDVDARQAHQHPARTSEIWRASRRV